jgi:hypothetical protein
VSSEAGRKPTLQDRFRRAEQVLYRDLQGEVVLLDTESGSYLGLDETGSRIWHLLGEEMPLGGVVERLLEEYDVDRATCERDLLELVEELTGHGLVVLAP